MKKIANYFPGLFISLNFISCFGDLTPVSSSQLLSKYPLRQGNYWNYNRTIYPPFIPGSSHKDTIIYENYTIECLNREILANHFSTHPLITICNDTISSTPLIYGTSYYSNESDGLYLYGYSGIGIVTPKFTHPTLQFKGKYYQNIHDLISQLSVDHLFPAMSSSDSLYLEVPPVKILPYPLNIGEFWGFREFDGCRIAKKISAREMVRVPAGIFDAYQVRFLYDLDDDGHWDEDISMVDDYANIGLIRRTFAIEDMKLLDEFGNVIGIGDLLDQFVLIDYGIYP